MATTRKKANKNRLVIEGELTIYVAAELKEKIAALLAAEDAAEIDLSQTSEIDTAGLQLLLLAKSESDRLNKTIAFSQPSEAVLECWQLCNVSEFFGANAASAR